MKYPENPHVVHYLDVLYLRNLMTDLRSQNAQLRYHLQFGEDNDLNNYKVENLERQVEDTLEDIETFIKYLSA